MPKRTRSCPPRAQQSGPATRRSSPTATETCGSCTTRGNGPSASAMSGSTSSPSRAASPSSTAPTRSPRRFRERRPSATHRSRAGKLMREQEATLSLDGEWEFVADPERLYLAANLPQGEPITVPGCWEAQVPRPYRIITAWYRRSFEAPAEWDGSHLL